MQKLLFFTHGITREFETHAAMWATQYIELIKKKNNNNPVALTFFLGRFTSSFIEAHLFNVLSRLREKEIQGKIYKPKKYKLKSLLLAEE